MSALTSRFPLLVLFLFVFPFLLLSGCQRGSPSLTPTDSSTKSAVKYLLSKQGKDGAWRSETYGHFKDGPTLTALVVQALSHAPQTRKTAKAIARGKAYLSGPARSGDEPVNYEGYTAALSVLVLSEPADRDARDFWLSYLRERQLTDARGWAQTDDHFGGWGYATGLPDKPPANATVVGGLIESNTSATLYALEALRAAGVAGSDPAYKHALTFLRRVQNFGDNATLDDGGFFFLQGDEVRNKAGRANAPNRFRSYGGPTADGYRGLILAGLPPTNPRVAAAKRWLEANFRADSTPGGDAPGTYYYWVASIARAPRVNFNREALVAAVMATQRPDGSWANTHVDQFEDDPIVATALALIALTSSS